jgi:hypothetical protein
MPHTALNKTRCNSELFQFKFYWEIEIVLVWINCHVARVWEPKLNRSILPYSCSFSQPQD